MYVIVWEFRVRPDALADFERAYGRDGDWDSLFRNGQGFIDIELLRDADEGTRFVTIDRWTSKSAYDAFRKSFESEYAAIDARNESLTVFETKIGEFETS